MDEFIDFNNAYSDLITQSLPIPDVQRLSVKTDEITLLQHQDLKVPQTLVATEIEATSRCSIPNNPKDPEYINLIIEAFKRDENDNLTKVCREIATELKKLSYPNGASKVTVYCAVVEMSTYKLQ